MTHQVRVTEFFENRNIDEFDVQILIHGLKRPTDGNVVFELNSYFMVDERLEEALATRVLAQECLLYLGVQKPT